MGEKSPHGYHTPFQPPHAKENIFSAASQQALPYDHGPRYLLKFASHLPRFQIQFWPVSLIVYLMADDTKRKIGMYSCRFARTFLFGEGLRLRFVLFWTKSSFNCCSTSVDIVW
jgi:hypothetical protein